MQIPDELPGIKWLYALWVVTAVAWSALEGDLRRVSFFGLLTTSVALVYLLRRLMAGRMFGALPGLLIMGGWGVALGVGTGFMTLFLMAIKTGLHAHGPEFTAAEISTIWQQLPLLSLVGAVGGVGVGLLLLARTPRSD